MKNNKIRKQPADSCSQSNVATAQDSEFWADFVDKLDLEAIPGSRLDVIMKKRKQVK